MDALKGGHTISVIGIILGLLGIVPWLLKERGINVPPSLVIAGGLIVVIVLAGGIYMGALSLLSLWWSVDHAHTVSIALAALLAGIAGTWWCLTPMPPGFRLTQEEWKHFTKWEKIYGRKFLNEEVVIDGKFFDRCEFTNVSLMFHGTGPVKIENPIWHGNVVFKSDNLAVITAGYLMELVYQLAPVMTGKPAMVGTADEHGNIKAIEINPQKLSPKSSP